MHRVRPLCHPRTQNSSSPSSPARSPMRAPRVVRTGSARGGGATNGFFLVRRRRADGEPSSSLPSSSSSSLPSSSSSLEASSSALEPRSSCERGGAGGLRSVERRRRRAAAKDIAPHAPASLQACCCAMHERAVSAQGRAAGCWSRWRATTAAAGSSGRRRQPQPLPAIRRCRCAAGRAGSSGDRHLGRTSSSSSLGRPSLPVISTSSDAGAMAAVRSECSEGSCRQPDEGQPRWRRRAAAGMSSPWRPTHRSIAFSCLLLGVAAAHPGHSVPPRWPSGAPPLGPSPPSPLPMPGGTPDPSAVLRGHAGEVQAIDFDASERHLVSGCAAAARSTAACSCCSLPASCCLPPLLPHPATHHPSCHSDSAGVVRVWCLADLRPLSIRRLHPLSAGILSLRLFASGGRGLLCTQGRDGTTSLWACDDQLQLSE